jgi:YVTN family beta-propeller protein
VAAADNRKAPASWSRVIVADTTDGGTFFTYSMGGVMRRAIYSAIVLGLIASAAPVPAPRRNLIFVENSQSGDVSVIDAATLKVVGRISIGLSPNDIIASPSGNVLYLDRIVRRDDGRQTGNGEVIAIDPATSTVLWRAALHGVPHHMAVSPDGKRIYITIVSGTWVDILDPATHAVVDSVEVGTGPHHIEVSRDGKHVYVGLIRDTAVTIFDAATKTVIRRIPFDQNVRPIAVSHDETRLYVQLSHTHAIMVVDPKAGRILRRVAMPVPAETTLPDTLPIDVNHGLRVTADGKFLIANGSIVDVTTVWAIPSMKLVATIPVGHEPNWIVLSADEKLCFVSNRRSDDVSVLDLATYREVARIKVGKYPQRMAAVSVAAK